MITLRFLPSFGDHCPKTAWLKLWQYRLAQKNVAYRWGTLSSCSIPRGIFILLNSPVLLSIARNYAPQLRIYRGYKHAEGVGEKPDLVETARLRTAKRSLCFERQWSMHVVSHRRRGTLLGTGKWEPIEVKSTRLMVLNWVFFFLK